MLNKNRDALKRNKVFSPRQMMHEL